MDKSINLLGRILISAMFIVAGIGKISGYAATQGYMASKGVPGALLPLVILLELGGGLALLVGFQTRWVAWAFAAFCIVSAVIFHSDLADRTQMVMFMKNLAIAGGLMILAQVGASGYSIDRAKDQRAG